MRATEGSVGRIRWRAEARRLLVVGAPSVLAGLALGLAWVLPEESVWGQALAALLWTAPPWLALVQALWGPALAWRWRARWPLLALVALAGVGRPVPLLDAARRVAPAEAVSIGMFNVNAFSPAPAAELEAWAGALELDVVVLLEKRGETIPGMVRVADDFEPPLHRASHHSAVFCREGLACDALITPQLGSPSMAMPFALVALPGVDRCLIGLHAPPQVPKNPSGMRPHLQVLRDRVAGGRLSADWGPCSAGQGAVVAGDLNHVPHSRPWWWLRRAGLDDVVAGVGIFGRTWPSGGGWPDLPTFRLDQVMVGAASVGALRRVAVPGSDHRGWIFAVW